MGYRLQMIRTAARRATAGEVIEFEAERDGAVVVLPDDDVTESLTNGPVGARSDVDPTTAVLAFARSGQPASRDWIYFDPGKDAFDRRLRLRSSIHAAYSNRQTST